MPEVHQVADAVAGANFRSPKTVLGFFAIVLGILATASAAVVAVLARTPALHHLIVPVLCFAATVLLIVLIGVFITAWKDPTILMLGQVSGEIFIKHRRLTMGDSLTGEHKEPFLLVQTEPLVTLPAPTQDQSEGA